MSPGRPLISVCIPAYNRARHLPALLDSILEQDFKEFDVVICEDQSPERTEIAAIVQRYSEAYPGLIHYYENEINLGYDGNLRNLVEKATGVFCFFMGNDDLMCPGALANVADVIARNPDVGFVLKSYSWFLDKPTEANGGVRYFERERRFAPGREAILLCYRRSGVISGYVIRRDPAHAVATDRYDGTLYYQLYLTVRVLATWPAVFTPKVLILCRNSEPPEFGRSAAEKDKYVPGRYTIEARLNMIRGALTIIRDFQAGSGMKLADDVQGDFANYFFPYVQDQVNLPVHRYFSLYWGYARMGFFKYPMFHLYCLMGYILKARNFDRAADLVRHFLGRSPHFGSIGK